MEINDPKQLIILGTALRIMSELGPMMGVQGLTDDQSARVYELANDAHTAIRDAVYPTIQKFLDPSHPEMQAMTVEELYEWEWFMDLVHHMEFHAEQARATYEQLQIARRAALN